MPADRSLSKPSEARRTACDTCRRMKIKCERDESNSRCRFCQARSLSCIIKPITHRLQTEDRRRSRMTDLGSRIERIERVLAASSTSSTSSNPYPSQVTDELFARLSTLAVDEESSELKTSLFWGPSSAFSLFSPQGLSWIADKTGTQEIQELFSDLVRANQTRHTTLEYFTLFNAGVSENRTSGPLGTIATRYITIFFDLFGVHVPFIDRQYFFTLYELEPSPDPLQNPAWYSLLNLVYATIRKNLDLHHNTFHPATSTECEKDMNAFGDYLRNACSVFTSLMFATHSLLAVQALLTMAFVFDSILDTDAAYMILGVATRLSYGMGLHKNTTTLQHQLLATGQRHRYIAFWTLYSFEKNLSLRLGRPSVIQDDDIDHDPPLTGKSAETFLGGESLYSTFPYQIALSRIENRVYLNLYSAASQKKSPKERLESIVMLDQQLCEWEASLPPVLRLKQANLASSQHFVPVVMLHFAFFNCVSTLHRAPLHTSFWAARSEKLQAGPEEENEISSQILSSHVRCADAARNTAAVLEIYSDSDKLRQTIHTSIGMYYPFNSFVILFANSLEFPSNSSIGSDKDLMNSIIRIFPQPGTDCQDSLASIAGVLFGRLMEVLSRHLDRHAACAVATDQPSTTSSQDTSRPNIPALRKNKMILTEGDASLTQSNGDISPGDVVIGELDTRLADDSHEHDGLFTSQDNLFQDSALPPWLGEFDIDLMDWWFGDPLQ